MAGLLLSGLGGVLLVGDCMCQLWQGNAE